MKRILVLLFVASALAVSAQPRKAPKMAPVTAPGYYVGTKNDTVRGEVQTNPEDETMLYRSFSFQLRPGSKLVAITTKKAKAYGFEDKNFVRITDEDGDKYLERLAEGRLNFFKYRFQGKIDGLPAIETQYYMQDTRAEGDQADLKEIKKISTKFYKKDLKNYMKDQPMIWSDLDKFTFDERAVINAINEFNKYYTPTAD